MASRLRSMAWASRLEAGPLRSEFLCPSFLPLVLMGSSEFALSQTHQQVNADPSPKGWCNLRQLCYVIESLAAILCDRWGDKGGIGGLACHTGSAIRASYTSKDCKWSLTVSHGNGDTSLLRCDAVVIATGGTPRLPEDMTLPDKLGVRVLEQPTALVPSRLAQTVSAESSVAIVGNSHSVSPAGHAPPPLTPMNTSAHLCPTIWLSSPQPLLASRCMLSLPHQHSFVRANKSLSQGNWGDLSDEQI